MLRSYLGMALIFALGIHGLGIMPNLFGQTPPEAMVDRLIVAENMQVQLFAHEPDLMNPTSIDIDAQGRVWVAEAVNYRRINFNRPILRPEGDRIVVLIDERGEGKATKAVTFYQGPELYGPLSVCVIPQRDRRSLRVLVAQSPDILEFWDRDGDLKADGPPTKFLSGFGGFDHDHGVHGLHLGPDGKLYFTVGDSGVGIGRDRNGQPIPPLQARDGRGRRWQSNNSDCQAGTVWRCDLDGTHLELIAHNFRNNYEACVDSFGEIWLSDNDDDGNQQTRICFVLPGGNYGYYPRGPGQSHWHEEQPGIVHKVLRTGFGSPTGIQFYEGTLFGPKYFGALLHCDAGPREVRAFFRRPKGAGYELAKEVLLTSTDSWFRPSDVCVAPDGSIFVADWYDPGVGGHGMGDWTRGRIYRLTPKGHQGYNLPQLKLDTPESVLAAFESPNLPVRMSALPIVVDWLNDAKADWRELRERVTNFTSRGRIIYAAAQTSIGRVNLLRTLLQFSKNDFLTVSETEAVLRTIAQQLASKQLGGISFDNQALRAVSEVKHRIGREFLLMARHLDVEQCKPLFDALAKGYNEPDHFYRAALNIACGTDAARRDALLAEFDQHFPEWNHSVADLVWELRPKSMLPKLARLLANDQLSPAERARLVEILGVYDDPKTARLVLQIAATDPSEVVQNRALELLRTYLPHRWRAMTISAELSDTIRRLLNDPATRIRGMKLVAAAKQVTEVTKVIAIAQDPSAPTEHRLEAIRTLGQLPDEKSAAALADLLRLTQETTLFRMEVAAALGAYLGSTGRESAAMPAMQALQETLLAKENVPEELRTAALDVIASTRIGTDWLLSLKEAGKMPDALVGPVGRLLRNSPFQAQRNKAMLLFPAPGKLDPAKLPSLAMLARSRGNADRGQQLLAASRQNEAQCLKCHTIRGVGGHVGPDLSMIGLKASRENLLESILNPSKAIADQFAQYTIETTTGQLISGILIAQGETSVTLRDANGKDHTFTSVDVESMTKSSVSIMPADIVKAFTEDELLDVVEYLLTLRTPAYTPISWQVVGPFPAKSMLDGLDRATDVEKHPFVETDTFTEEGQRKAITAGFLGRLSWNELRVDGHGYVDLATRYGAASQNSFSYAFASVHSPTDQAATILLGSDDGAKLFVNGELVVTVRETRAASPDQNRVPVRLKKGRNTLLLKVANGDGPHGFYLTIESGQELKAASIAP